MNPAIVQFTPLMLEAFSNIMSSADRVGLYSDLSIKLQGGSPLGDKMHSFFQSLPREALTHPGHAISALSGIHELDSRIVDLLKRVNQESPIQNDALSSFLDQLSGGAKSASLSASDISAIKQSFNPQSP